MEVRRSASSSGCGGDSPTLTGAIPTLAAHMSLSIPLSLRQDDSKAARLPHASSQTSRTRAMFALAARSASCGGTFVPLSQFPLETNVSPPPQRCALPPHTGDSRRGPRAARQEGQLRLVCGAQSSVRTPECAFRRFQDFPTLFSCDRCEGIADEKCDRCAKGDLECVYKQRVSSRPSPRLFNLCSPSVPEGWCHHYPPP